MFFLYSLYSFRDNLIICFIFVFLSFYKFVVFLSFLLDIVFKMYQVLYFIYEIFSDCVLFLINNTFFAFSVFI